MKKILLIGFRGTGKTTLGMKIAKALGWEFIDADEELEKSAGKSIREMVSERGWTYFRELEREHLKSLLGKSKVVCALGGGAILHKEEMGNLKKESLVIALKADLVDIKERLMSDPKTLSQRPSLTSLDWEREVETLYVERLPRYQEFAHVVFNTSEASSEELVLRVIDILKKEDCP
ncbi:MAG: shikimate kinase [Caldimicrobium sp.]|nr:shikimate kinase [Caldimicrobium sp.]MCX7613015.1 shikimate kinase [Caldimicrobium sp.]MDW8182282.1 shikimate kinase [Caldimicrobium sp.]